MMMMYGFSFPFVLFLAIVCNILFVSNVVFVLDTNRYVAQLNLSVILFYSNQHLEKHLLSLPKMSLYVGHLKTEHLCISLSSHSSPSSISSYVLLFYLPSI
jgi:hypothetical protein